MVATSAYGNHPESAHIPLWGRGMLEYAKGRVDNVGISLKVRKVRTIVDQRRDATITSGHVEIRDAQSCDDLFA